jgi:hypothetical protein
MRVPWVGSRLRKVVRNGRTVDAAVDAVVDAVIGHHPAAVRRALDAAAAQVGPGPCVDAVLMPAVGRIARRPADDDVTDLLLAVEAARGWLESFVAYAPAPGVRPSVVLACGPGDRHSLGLEALAMLLRYQRQPCRMLGARVTAGRMSTAVEVNRPAGVVLVTYRDSCRRASTDVLRALHDIGTPVFYAGTAFDTVPARHGVPGTYLGTSFQGACATIVRSLSTERGDATARTE